MAEKGFTSARAAEVAAYRTRDRKEYGVDPDSRREEWLARAAKFELTPSSIDKQIRLCRPREPKPIESADVDRALIELEQRHSHFDRRELLCMLANQLPEGADM